MSSAAAGSATAAAVALHPEGVDRNNPTPRFRGDMFVALHPEGVDRNGWDGDPCLLLLVALHPEGVERNSAAHPALSSTCTSPSTRRAWIEMIVMPLIRSAIYSVALHPEGVDRNSRSGTPCRRESLVALHPEGVDRNPDHPFKVRDDEESPSTRRARVERKS